MGSTRFELDEKTKQEERGGLTKYVRIRNRIDDRFVEFDFAINEPSLFVELIMPVGAFDAFCEQNHVIFMSAEQADVIDQEMQKWRYGDETLMASNHSK